MISPQQTRLVTPCLKFHRKVSDSEEAGSHIGQYDPSPSWITPNSAHLTHSVPSWNHSPQNEYKGDSCRADDGQVWIMRPVIHFLTSWQRWRTASPCSCGRCAPYRSQQSVPCSDRRRGSWRPLESHYCPWTEADCSWHCKALYKHRPGRGVTSCAL